MMHIQAVAVSSYCVLILVSIVVPVLAFGQRIAPPGLVNVFVTGDHKLLQEFYHSDGSLRNCEVFADRFAVEVPEGSQQLVDSSEFYRKVKVCHDFMLRRQPDEHGRDRRSITQGIYPGTLWCGRLNIANHSEALGDLKEEDDCCRRHDQCFPKIEAGKTKYGIKNDGMFTAFDCEECDRKFYNCLKRVDSIHSNLIGFAFFNVIDGKCLGEDYPLVCETWLWFFETCERDTSEPKVLQLKDFPDYY